MGNPKQSGVLDHVKKKDICALLALGCSRKTAAAYVGCCVRTIRRTAKRDDEFATEIRHAESLYEVSHLKNIKAAGEKNWRASAWALERQFPDQYGQRRAGTVTGSQLARALAEFAHVVTEEISNPEDRRRAIARLEALVTRFERDWEFERQLGMVPPKRKRRTES